MFFSQLPTKEASLSYFFGCGGEGRAMAVDVVAGDENWYIRQAKERDVEITHVIDTHVHADHYSGGKALADMVGAKYCLHERILTLLNEVEIYPGHQAGSACGAGLSGKPNSTIGFEKRFNPKLSMDRDAFIDSLTQEIPPRPAAMDRMVAANISA